MVISGQSHASGRASQAINPHATTIGAIAEFVGGSQPPKTTFRFKPFPGFVRLVQIRDYKTDEFATYVPDALVRRRCDSGDVMIGRYGPPIFQILRGISGAYNVALIKATPKGELGREYLYYVLQRDDLYRLIDSLSRRSSGQTGVDMNALRDFVVFVPPPCEQALIVHALADIDALIQSLERLIAKKRGVKQAAMQQLLTGQTRLPGFSGEWRKSPFGQFVAIRNTKRLPATCDQDTYCIELEHIEPSEGRLIGWNTARSSVSAKYEFKAGDVLFGRLRAYLRKFWLADRDGLCSTEIWPLMPNDTHLVSKYLRYVVETDQFVDAAAVSYGTHMPRADWSVIRELPVALPAALEEQRAIAEVLSDMDAEITALEARLMKTRDLKQGMMQELLTGRTRLV